MKGRRVWVSLVLDLLASGASIEAVAKEYDLADDDVRACIAYGAEMARYADGRPAADLETLVRDAVVGLEAR